MDLSLGRFFNLPLAKEPMNWLIVWTVASLWLLAFHVIMQGFQAMQTGPQGSFNAPGQMAAQVPDVTSQFSQYSPLASGGGLNDVAAFLPGGLTGSSSWGDSIVARYAEDGWAAN